MKLPIMLLVFIATLYGQQSGCVVYNVITEDGKKVEKINKPAECNVTYTEETTYIHFTLNKKRKSTIIP